MSDDLFKYVVFKDASWDFRTLDVAKHLELARQGRRRNGECDIAEYQAVRGPRRKAAHLSRLGRHQRSAPIIGELLQASGGNARSPQVDRSVRLYMAPGMGHCGGGEGPNVFDALSAVEQWREKGKAPAEILASKVTDDQVVRTRPLCPYPQHCLLQGIGQHRPGTELRLPNSLDRSSDSAGGSREPAADDRMHLNVLWPEVVYYLHFDYEGAPWRVRASPALGASTGQG